jgi:hypothetical protein
MKKLFITLCLGLCIQIAFAQNAAQAKEEYCRVDLVSITLGTGKPIYTIHYIKPDGVIELKGIDEEKPFSQNWRSEWMKFVNKLATQGWIVVNTTSSETMDTKPGTPPLTTSTLLYTTIMKRVL